MLFQPLFDRQNMGSRSRRRSGRKPNLAHRERGSVFSRRKRLVFEHLEERTLLATITWINPSGGNWNSLSNWRDSSNVNRVPGSADDVVIPDIGAAGVDQTITVSTATV